MKPLIFILTAACAFLGGFHLTSVFPPNNTIKAEVSPAHTEPEIVMLGMPSAYGIKVLVEPEGYYIGEECMTLHEVPTWINKAKSVHRVKSVLVKPSDTAQYGDVIAILGLLRKDKSYYSTISIRPLPSGRRMNAWAYYKSYCCGSDDILSEEFKAYQSQHR